MKRVRADQLLLARGYFESRSRAKAAIEAGLVTADGETVRKASQEILDASVIEAEAPHPYVSRGGLKLAHALDHFDVPVEGKICLDVGASTGGFSDVLMKRGAAKIYAVDTGRNQFHRSLRTAPEIVLMEGSDIRSLPVENIADPVEVTVIDVSFISLSLVLPRSLAFSAPGAALIALVKPQFEVGRANIGKGGIVKDETLYAPLCDRLAAEITQMGWSVMGVIPSIIEGGDGNREFVLAACRTGKNGFQ